jgi:hypothetical protein
MQAAVVHTKASTLDPALLQLVTSMNLFGTVIRVTPSYGATIWDGKAATIRMRIWCRGDDMIGTARWRGQARRGTESSCSAVAANHVRSRVAARLRRSHRGRDQGWPGGRHQLRHRG